MPTGGDYALMGFSDVEQVERWMLHEMRDANCGRVYQDRSREASRVDGRGGSRLERLPYLSEPRNFPVLDAALRNALPTERALVSSASPVCRWAESRARPVLSPAVAKALAVALTATCMPGVSGRIGKNWLLPLTCNCASTTSGKSLFILSPNTQSGDAVPVSYTHLTLPTKR